MAQLLADAKKAGIPAEVIQDAYVQGPDCSGRTQVAPGSRTVIGIGPGMHNTADRSADHADGPAHAHVQAPVRGSRISPYFPWPCRSVASKALDASGFDVGNGDWVAGPLRMLSRFWVPGSAGCGACANSGGAGGAAGGA